MSMKIVIFGAAGGTGRHLMEQSLGRDYHVTAVARNPAAITLRHAQLVVITGNVRDPASVNAAVMGQDAVLWAVGGHDTLRTAWSGRSRQADLCSVGTQHILTAMAQHGVHRLVCLSSWGVGDSIRRVPALFRWVIFPLVLQGELADKERQEALIQASVLDWTIVRPARLIDGPWTGSYRVGHRLAFPVGARIIRADVADFMLQQLTDGAFLQTTVEISG